jgi:hypothetical protein
VNSENARSSPALDRIARDAPGGTFSYITRVKLRISEGQSNPVGDRG